MANGIAALARKNPVGKRLGLIDGQYTSNKTMQRPSLELVVMFRFQDA